jgi:hypothetical protein
MMGRGFPLVMSVSISLHPLLFYYSAILYHAAQTYFTMFSTTCHDSFQTVAKNLLPETGSSGNLAADCICKIYTFVSNPFTFDRGI